MRKSFFIMLLCLLAMSSCRTTKKVTATKVDSAIAIASKEEISTTENMKVANDANTETTTITKKTVYNKPDPVDTSKVVPAKGSVLSEEETITVIKQVDKGKVETIKKEETKKDLTAKDNSKTDTKVTDTKVVPTQWWAIFGILVIVLVIIVAAYLFFTKSPAGIAAKTFIKNL